MSNISDSNNKKNNNNNKRAVDRVDWSFSKNANFSRSWGRVVVAQLPPP